MHTVLQRFRVAPTVIPLLALGWAFSTASAGEKAAISVPIKPPSSGSPALTRPQPGVESINPGNSVGGVVDPSAAPPQISPSVPDARTQKEIIERIDRKRNWLLDDSPKSGKSPGASLLLESLDNPDYTSNPRRPTTSLERRLKSGSRASNAGESAAREPSEREAYSESDDHFLGEKPGDPWSLRRNSTGLNPLSAGTATPLLPSYQSASPQAPGIDIARPTASATLGRNAGLDSLSQERLDRYQRLSGTDVLGERTTSLAASVDQSRSRESRSEFLGHSMKSSADAAGGPGSLLPKENPLTAQNPVRSSLASPNPQGIVANPYAGPPAPPEPYVTPAAKLLRAPPVEPPRFRP
ncbi:MAG: hypothetical protein JNL10_14555 [Verrucomicrobiales bacterium]|nr:hypothetical protein [Verrucomicrobiales bacterium]